MLAEGLVERLAGGYLLRQSGVKHQTYAARTLPHRSRLASRATRHTHVALVSQLPNKLITMLLGGGFQYTRMGVGKGNVEVVNI